MEHFKILDLGIYRTPECSVYSGFERGHAVRREMRLNFLDVSEKPVKITVPDDVIAISRSFVNGLLSESVDCLGVDGTISRYGIMDLNQNIREQFLSALRSLKPVIKE